MSVATEFYVIWYIVLLVGIFEFYDSTVWFVEFYDLAFGPLNSTISLFIIITRRNSVINAIEFCNLRKRIRCRIHVF